MTYFEQAARQGLKLGVLYQTPSGHVAVRQPLGLVGDALLAAARVLARFRVHPQAVLDAAERLFAARRRPPARFE